MVKHNQQKTNLQSLKIDLCNLTIFASKAQHFYKYPRVWKHFKASQSVSGCNVLAVVNRNNEWPLCIRGYRWRHAVIKKKALVLFICSHVKWPNGVLPLLCFLYLQWVPRPAPQSSSCRTPSHAYCCASAGGHTNTLVKGKFVWVMFTGCFIWHWLYGYT